MKTGSLIAALAMLAVACGGSHNRAPTSSTTTTTTATINPQQTLPPSNVSQPPPTPADVNDANGTGKTRQVVPRGNPTPPPGAQPVSPGTLP